MSIIWASDTDDPILDDPKELKHDQQDRSACCKAPLDFHWPCDLRAKCTACGYCEECEVYAGESWRNEREATS